MPSQEEVERRMVEVAKLYTISCSSALSKLEGFLEHELCIQRHCEDPKGQLASPDTQQSHAEELSWLVEIARLDSTFLTPYLRECHEWVSPLWAATGMDYGRLLDEFCARQTQRLEMAKARTDLDPYINDIRQLNGDIESIKPIAKVLSARLSTLWQEMEECKELAAGYCDRLANQTPCDHWAHLQMLHRVALHDFDD